jgi:tRNA nucleotidyltransferase/poly(A) polymerase
MTNRKIEALQEAAAQKAKESAERVEKALEKMIKQGQIISFKSVAQSANVSTAYLYKQEDLRNRIETLRDQQKQRPKTKQPPVASDNSKSVIISTLREQNKKLRAEIEGLRRVNEGLAGRVYHLQGADELAQRLKAENAELKQQLEECRRHSTPPTPPKDNLKVTSIEKKRTKQTGGNDSIKSELDALKIKVNTTLSKLIEQVPEETVLKGIDALKEALSKAKVRNPAGFLAEAIRNTWIPNEGYEEKVELDIFKEWFPLAKSKGLVVASTKVEGVLQVCTPEGEWIPFEEMVAKYSLESLKLRNVD